ncbi:Fructosamine kinase [uncultured Paludibacter sp.]|nr:Fructosamine kinase [uncultured Paludibacter sp.]
MKLIDYLSDKTGIKLTDIKPVSGGDISAAYQVKSADTSFFLKTNNKPFAKEMFSAEKTGLDTIEKTNSIAVPHVFLTDNFESQSFILMEFIESKRPNSIDLQTLGTQLAALHQCRNAEFGFETNNFIGSLPQSNIFHQNWSEFYWFERIFPQLKMAFDNHLLSKNESPSEEKAMKVFNEIFGEVKPSLLHGDLWGGNYLISTGGVPYLIDPATYYGHSMVDIAMTKLFGGFDSEFYNAYHEIIPKTENYDCQIELYQLYYLLIHLNIFGSGYYSGVKNILKRYFL